MNDIEIKIDGVSYKIEEAPIIPNVSNCEFCDIYRYSTLCGTSVNRGLESLCHGKLWGMPHFVFKQLENDK